MRKKTLSLLASVILTICILIPVFPATPAAALDFIPDATVQSEAAILLNLDVGAVVYEKNADMKQVPSSLTQIMTAVVVLEECQDLNTKTITATQEMFAPFSDYAYQSDLRYANINAGDTLTVGDALSAMLLTSSCEASAMLAAEFGGGSEDAFVEKMNAKAAALGMKDTRFTNATGLYSARQTSTARDLMTLLQYALSLPRFEGLASAETYTPQNAAELGKEEEWHWEHSNIMMDSESEYYYNGVKGIKTGNSEEGGRSIALKASKDGNNYLLVCLNAPFYDEEGNSRFYHIEDAKNILDWAFVHLSYQEIISTNTEIDERPVKNAKGANFVIIKPSEGYSCMWCDTMDSKTIKQIVELEEEYKAPITAGDKLGQLTLKYAGETLAEIDLVAGASVERSLLRYNLGEIPGFFRSTYLRTTWKLGIALSVIYIAACILFYVLYRQKRKKHPQQRNGAPRSSSGKRNA